MHDAATGDDFQIRGGQAMSDSKGNIAAGKAQQKLTVEVTGKLKPEQWAELTEKLRALAKSYNADIDVRGPANP